GRAQRVRAASAPTTPGSWSPGEAVDLADLVDLAKSLGWGGAPETVQPSVPVTGLVATTATRQFQRLEMAASKAPPEVLKKEAAVKTAPWVKGDREALVVAGGGGGAGISG